MKVKERVVMMFGFEKKDLANISTKELRGFKRLAKVYLESSAEDMQILVKRGKLSEIKSPESTKAK